MSQQRIEQALGDFRIYLEALLEPPPAPVEVPPAYDLATLTAQFTALRHDVNLQTKATRSATDVASQAMKQLATMPTPASIQATQNAATKPLLKVLIDIADALSTAQKQIERSQSALEPLVQSLALPLPSEPRSRGFFSRLFSTKPGGNDAKSEALATIAQSKLMPLLAGLGDGYALSLRRVENTLPNYDLEPIRCIGMHFEPELMEVLEVVGGTGQASGTVVEEVRRGYRWHGEVFRFAQVKVAG